MGITACIIAMSVELRKMGEAETVLFVPTPIAPN
jgi:hypothetical protein